MMCAFYTPYFPFEIDELIFKELAKIKVPFTLKTRYTRLLLLRRIGLQSPALGNMELTGGSVVSLGLFHNWFNWFYWFCFTVTVS